MRMAATSDLHGHLPDDVPEADYLLIAGDICPVHNHTVEYQNRWYDTEFMPWAVDLNVEKVIFVGGNHDFFTEGRRPEDLSHDKVNFLNNSTYQDDKICVWGTPYSLPFFDWANMANEEKIAEALENCPKNADIIISHGPPKGCRDRNSRDVNTGSYALYEWTKKNQPRYVVCGHIHEAYGSCKVNNTNVFNVSLNNVNYLPVNNLVEFEI